jgi:nucleoside phosphorylase
MRSELAPVVRVMKLETGQIGDTTVKVGRAGDTEVVATLTGIGMEPARQVTERLLDTTTVDHVMVVGIAGGVGPSVGIGDLVFPRVVVHGHTEEEYRPDHLGEPVTMGTIVSSDDFMVDPDVVAALIERGVIALDMETGAVAAVCAQRGVPWSVIRAISDMATDHPDGAVLGLTKPDGSPDGKAAAKFLLTNPGRIPQLMKLAKGAKLAATNAARAAAKACATA